MHMIFELPKLNYSKTALAPIMSEETLDLHHGKHHQTYITNLNNFIKDSEMSKMSLEEIIINSSKDKSKIGIFNNASQHWNTDEFKKQFIQAGITQFGSGWCWLSINSGKLVISKTPNAENTLIQNMKPILGCDVWEHSYYVDYKNRRPEYLENFYEKLINWEFVESQLD
jgi:Fe-Mn family superoxide dismutase